MADKAKQTQVQGKPVNLAGKIMTEAKDSATAVSPLRRTKIVATLGPASFNRIDELIIAGVNVFRMNFSHIKHENENDEYKRSVYAEELKIIKNIRETSRRLNKPVAILGDLAGPKIRVGVFKDGDSVILNNGDIISLKAGKEKGDSKNLYTSTEVVVEQLEEGMAVLLDDGNLRLSVTKRISKKEIKCQVISGGELKKNKGLNVPQLKLNVAAVTPKDSKDACFVVDAGLDYVAMSFVQSAQDVIELRKLIDDFAAKRDAYYTDLVQNKKTVGPDSKFIIDEDFERGRYPRIIAKIEKPQAIEDLDSILTVVDGIMVARGDLGVECSLEQVPVMQKIIISKTNAAGKPVITATQMMESMISAPVPTRAEVSDVANAVFDGTDAVMLSAESASGKYPIETVLKMSSICLSVEQSTQFMRAGITAITNRTRVCLPHEKFHESIADATVVASAESSAKAIVVMTLSGTMGACVSKRRPPMPIIAITATTSVLQRMCLYFGVYPLILEDISPRRQTSLQHLANIMNMGEISTPTKNQLIPEKVMKTSSSLAFVSFNTDQVLAETEKLIEKEHSWIKLKDPLIFCTGYHETLPGLCNTLKLSFFGSAMQSEKATNE